MPSALDLKEKQTVRFPPALVRYLNNGTQLEKPGLLLLGCLVHLGTQDVHSEGGESSELRVMRVKGLAGGAERRPRAACYQLLLQARYSGSGVKEGHLPRSETETRLFREVQ